MAGLFDFKSAEDILKERQDATRKNVMQAFNQPGQYKVRGERAANAVGKALGLLGGKLFADSPEEQVAGQMQRANQLAQSLKPVEGESQSQFYNRIAGSFNDNGYSQNALRALSLAKQAEEAEAKEAQRQLERGEERNELTKWQQAQNKNQEDRIKLLRDEYNLLNGGGGTGAGDGTNPPVPTKEGSAINIDGVDHVVVNGKPVPVSQVEAAQNLSDQDVTSEPGVGEKFVETVSYPWQLLSNWSQEVADQRIITTVKNSLEKNSFGPEARELVKSVLQMPREVTGFTEKQYKILEDIDKGGLKLGGQ